MQIIFDAAVIFYLIELQDFATRSLQMAEQTPGVEFYQRFMVMV